jgi:hypothetical protein
MTPAITPPFDAVLAIGVRSGLARVREEIFLPGHPKTSEVRSFVTLFESRTMAESGRCDGCRRRTFRFLDRARSSGRPEELNMRTTFDVVLVVGSRDLVLLSSYAE